MLTPGPLARTQCSLLILLATPAEEIGLLDAARNLGISIETIKHRELGQYHWFGTIGTETVIAACPSRRKGKVVMGATGRFGTAAKAIHLRRLTGAQAIVQLGMAFGVDPTAQNLGDVLVSSSLIHYDDRTIVHAPAEPSGYRVDYSRAEEEPARPGLVSLLKREGQQSHAFGIHFGVILTGAARIHSTAYRDEVVRGVGKGEDAIVGGEMEGVGLIGASISDEDPIWCIVKGISDFADEDRNLVIGASRPLACRNAASFLLSALQNAERR